jgi:hypothetical protein
MSQMKVDNKINRANYLFNIINVRSLLQAFLIGLIGVSINFVMIIGSAMILDKKFAETMADFIFYPFYLSLIFYLFCLIFKKRFKFFNVIIIVFIVLISTPNRSDYQLDYTDLAPNANKINVYDVNDGVQICGGIGSDSKGGKWEFAKVAVPILFGKTPAERTLDGFQNISVKQTKVVNFEYQDFEYPEKSPKIILRYNLPLGPQESHGNLDSAPIWNN